MGERREWEGGRETDTQKGGRKAGERLVTYTDKTDTSSYPHTCVYTLGLHVLYLPATLDLVPSPIHFNLC